jgi:23S rRNA (cytidine1920-2'-O)/16S rRNA (cytidine1409-2'-O)-methyltransferase
MEKTDARNLTSDMFKPRPTLIVCDASFISLSKVLAVPLSLMLTSSDLIALVKPQFEVGRNNIGKGGLVKTNEAANKALTEVQLWFEASGWTVKGTDKSPITGGDGNKEFLIWAQK